MRQSRTSGSEGGRDEQSPGLPDPSLRTLHLIGVLLWLYPGSGVVSVTPGAITAPLF